MFVGFQGNINCPTCQVKKIKKIFVSRENISEVVLVDGIEVYPVDSLVDLILHLNEVKLISPFST